MHIPKHLRAPFPILALAALFMGGCATQTTSPVACSSSESKAKLAEVYNKANEPANAVNVTMDSEQFGLRKLRGLSNQRGQVLFEGDIELAKVSPAHKKGIAITGQSKRWPNGVVPFVIDSDFPNTSWAQEAMNEIHQKVPSITFVPRSGQADYIRLARGPNPLVGSSPVGRQHGGQTILVGSQCGTGVTIHEICHSLGLWHEQSYGRRDDYICILWDNITPGMEYNFGQHLKDGVDIGEFNWTSRMLYFDTAFSKNGKPTIVSKIPGKRINPDPRHLTAGDVTTLRTIYP